MLPSPTRRAPGAGWGTRSRTAVLAAVLLLAYLTVAVLGDPSAGIGSDAGGKLATARVMAEGSTLDPDVGYWAAAADPAGRFHPLVNSERVGNAWVQATSLPYSAATAPLWSLAGPLGPALLSMAGGVAAALAARHLARRLDGDPDLAFWLVGLGSPLAVYAVDAWEHAPAVGLAAWAVVLSLQVANHRQAAVVGLLLGAALVLRAEVGATVVALGVATLAVASARERWTRPPSRLAAGASGLGIVLLANALLERLVLEAGVRDARASGGVAGAGLDLGRRATDAALTAAGLFADETATGLFLAAMLVAGLAVLGVAAARPSRVPAPVTRAAAMVVVALYALRLLDGWSFVPGALAAAPVVVLALAAPRRDEVRVLLGTALGAVPLVWLLQWRGNHVAQWGGRYLLVSTVLLLMVAAVGLAGGLRRRPPAHLLLALTAVTALGGLGWHVTRTGAVGAAGDDLYELPESTVVVATDPHLGRELGSHHGELRWLSADAETVGEALTIAAAVAPELIAVVGGPGPDGEPVPLPEVDRYAPAGTDTVAWIGPDKEVRFLARR